MHATTVTPDPGITDQLHRSKTHDVGELGTLYTHLEVCGINQR